MGFYDLMSALISGGWSFFAELHVPGLPSLTFGMLFVATLLATLGIRLLFFVYGLLGGSSGDTPRTSSTKKPKISKERRRDEF